MPSTTRLPHLTAALPGTLGRIRDEDEDFVVEEIAAYEPAGAGDHLFLRIEKRGITTHEAAERIARALGRAPRDIGFAGLKDAHAVAVQTFSVEHVEAAAAETALASVSGIALRSARLHRNKLKLGHLRGNRFTIRVRGVVDGSAARARAILAVLAERGAPNWFGEQRFGTRADNDAIGRLLVRGDLDAACDAILGPSVVAAPVVGGESGGGEGDERAAEARRLYAAGDIAGAAAAMPRGLRAESRMLEDLSRGRSKSQAVLGMPRPLLRLLVSAYQSALFNRLAIARLPDLGRLETGDLAFLHDRGAVFKVTDAAAEQPRADRLEISPSAPLLGTDTLLADGAPGERERALIAEEGLTPAAFRVRCAGEMEGERRPVRIPIADPVAEELPAVPGATENVLVVSFSLPRGSYATTVLREVMKSD